MDRVGVFSILLIVALFSPEAAAFAQGKDASTDGTPLRPPLSLSPLSLTAEKTQDLGLDFQKFIDRVDRNYPKLIGAVAEKKIASAKRLEKTGAFDPVLTSVNEFLRVQDTFEPGKAKNAVHNESRIDLLTRSGIKVFTGMRLNPNDTKTPFVPSGKAGEYFGGVAVPLARGLMINEKAAMEKQAKLGEPLAEQLFGLTRLEVLLKAAASYYECMGARARLAVANDLLSLAVARTEQIKERVVSGDSPALEIKEAEQEIQRRQSIFVKAQREFQKAAYSLSVFLWSDAGTPGGVPRLEEVPSLSPEPILLSDEIWKRGRQEALDKRPELKRIELERKQVQIELKLAKNMILPAIDAYVSQGADTGPQGIGYVIRGGVAVSAPLRQRTARGQAQAASLKLEKLDQEEKAERLRIQTEVDDTVSAINTSYERYVANLEEVRKARDVEEGERMRYAAGDGTLFLVNQRERATAEARMRLAEVHTEYLQAMAAFRAVTCRL